MARQVRRFQVSPTVDTAVYAANDQVSTLQRLKIATAMRRGGDIKLITVMDAGLQKSALDLFFFDRSVTVAADNAAASFSDADMAFCLGVVNILAADYDDNAANSIATVAIDFPVMSFTADAFLYMAIVSRGTPDYVAATDLVISVTLVVEE